MYLNIQDVQELIKGESILKIVTDYISTEKKDFVEGVKKERRKGEEVWLEMWEREKVNKVVKKEIKEEERQGVDVSKENLEEETDLKQNLDEIIPQVS